jgi:hypothetical protein
MRPDPTAFTTSSRSPAVAAAVFVALFGGMAVLCLAGLVGLTPLKPPVAFSAVATAVFLALTVVFAVMLVHNAGNRLVVDARGVRATSRRGTIDLPWAEIESVGVVLLTSRPVVPDLVVPTPLDRTTHAVLEVRLRRPGALEADQPLLSRTRVRGGSATEPVHRFALPSARMIDTATAADYAPELQRLLPVLAGGSARATEVRRSWTLK